MHLFLTALVLIEVKIDFRNLSNIFGRFVRLSILNNIVNTEKKTVA